MDALKNYFFRSNASKAKQATNAARKGMIESKLKSKERDVKYNKDKDEVEEDEQIDIDTNDKYFESESDLSYDMMFWSTSPLPLVTFRIIFSFLFAQSLFMYMSSGAIEAMFSNPKMRFNFYYGFASLWIKVPEWVDQDTIRNGMWMLVALCAALTFGIRSHPCSLILAGATLYLLLLEKALYSDHSYFLSLLMALLSMTDSGAMYAVDGSDIRETIPFYQIFLFRFQILVVHLYQGYSMVASLDWMVFGLPLTSQLGSFLKQLEQFRPNQGGGPGSSSSRNATSLIVKEIIKELSYMLGGANGERDVLVRRMGFAISMAVVLANATIVFSILKPRYKYIGLWMAVGYHMLSAFFLPGQIIYEAAMILACLAFLPNPSQVEKVVNGVSELAFSQNLFQQSSNISYDPSISSKTNQNSGNRKRGSRGGRPKTIAVNKKEFHFLKKVMIGSYVLLQIVFPLRGVFFEQTEWTNEFYPFSWRGALQSDHEVLLRIFHKPEGGTKQNAASAAASSRKSKMVALDLYKMKLTAQHVHRMLVDPEMILQLATFSSTQTGVKVDQKRSENIHAAGVYVDCWKSLNGRPFMRFFDAYRSVSHRDIHTDSYLEEGILKPLDYRYEQIFTAVEQRQLEKKLKKRGYHATFFFAAPGESMSDMFLSHQTQLSRFTCKKDNDHSVFVSLVTGRIRVTTTNGDDITIKPGEEFVVPVSANGDETLAGHTIQVVSENPSVFFYGHPCDRGSFSLLTQFLSTPGWSKLYPIAEFSPQSWTVNSLSSYKRSNILNKM